MESDTLSRFDTVVARLEAHAQEQDSVVQQKANEESDRYAAALSPKSRTFKILKWSFITLIGGATAIFGGGVAYERAVEGNATKSDVDKKVKPIITRVAVLEETMKPVKLGVDKLVKAHNQEQEVERAKRVLARHDREYQGAMQEYLADKAARRPSGPRPRKTSAHVAAEAAVDQLEGVIQGEN